jgi:DNA-binding transcriptional MocR family regulator
MIKATLLSQRAKNLHGSPIREILRVVDQPNMVSFAGGLPAASAFPVLRPGEMPKRYLQYGPTEGEPELRGKLVRHLQSLGIHCGPDQMLILSGSQQGIDLVAKLFIDPGSLVAVESPTYLAALQVFRFFGARFNVIDSAKSNLGLSDSALAYINPTFQNPTGKCLTLEERRHMAQECDKRKVPLFEDDPYRDLVYDSCDRTPICAMVRKTSWIYQGSFSKTLAPGLRIGFLAASKNLFPFLNRLKQAADLHTNRLSQWLVLNYLRDPQRLARMAQLAQKYGKKRNIFHNALQKHFSDIAFWSKSPGGFFFWLACKRRSKSVTV